MDKADVKELKTGKAQTSNVFVINMFMLGFSKVPMIIFKQETICEYS